MGQVNNIQLKINLKRNNNRKSDYYGKLYEQADDDTEAVNKDVAGCLAQAFVELAAAVDALDLQVGVEMEDQEDEGQDKGQQVTIEQEHDTHQRCHDSQKQEEPTAVLRAQAYHQRQLTVLAVVVAVAVVVDDEQPVNDDMCQSASYLLHKNNVKKTYT